MIKSWQILKCSTQDDTKLMLVVRVKMVIIVKTAGVAGWEIEGQIMDEFGGFCTHPTGCCSG